MKKRRHNGLRLSPTKLRNMLGEVWYYEEKRGIHVYISAGLIRSSCNLGTGLNFTIGKAKLKESLARILG